MSKPTYKTNFTQWEKYPFFLKHCYSYIEVRNYHNNIYLYKWD